MSDEPEKDAQVNEPRHVTFVLTAQDATGPLVYANGCIANVADDVVFLDLVLVDPLSIGQQAREPLVPKHVARVILSREGAKRLQEALKRILP